MPFADASQQPLSLFSFEHLLRAYYRCRKNKRQSQSAARFEWNFERDILCMSEELQNGSYTIGRSCCFAVSDPKIREVWAADFRDRILHHLLVSFLEPFWEKRFIFSSFGCRPGKGAHRAVSALRKTLLEGGSQPIFFLQLDIESFFTSIDKTLLFELIRKKIRNSELLSLTQKIIFHDPLENYHITGDTALLASVPRKKSLFSLSKNKGLPIGNYTSQFFANVYLNELDQYVKHTLKCRRYFRYMDDFVLLHHSREQLTEWKDDIRRFLSEKLSLSLHPKKQTLQDVRHGINFLGYIIRPDYILSRRRLVGNLKRNLSAWNLKLESACSHMEREIRLSEKFFYGDLARCSLRDIRNISENIASAQASINASYGNLRHGNCFHVRKKLFLSHFGSLALFLMPSNESFEYFILRAPVAFAFKRNSQVF